MGWTFLALLWDYALSLLVIMAVLYILKAYSFTLRVQQKCLALASSSFPLGKE
jgi:hypothetical protein